MSPFDFAREFRRGRIDQRAGVSGGPPGKFPSAVQLQHSSWSGPHRAIRATGTHRYKRNIDHDAEEHSGIDTALQIRLLRKLKLAQCARRETAPGFCLASGAIEVEPLDRKRAGGPPGALRAMHGSNALRTAVYCFRIAVAMERASEPCISVLSSAGSTDLRRKVVIANVCMGSPDFAVARPGPGGPRLFFACYLVRPEGGLI